MTGPPCRSTWLRVVGVTLITGTITLAAACSDQDTVNTVPPPWPTRTVKPEGPTGLPGSTASTTSSPVTTSTSIRPTTTTGTVTP